MELGLSHSLSRCVITLLHSRSRRTKHCCLYRYKLKFSPDKVDTMIVQAIALLDDLDKEINIYSMRVKVCHLSLPMSLYELTSVLNNQGMVRMAFP